MTLSYPNAEAIEDVSPSDAAKDIITKQTFEVIEEKGSAYLMDATTAVSKTPDIVKQSLKELEPSVLAAYLGDQTIEQVTSDSLLIRMVWATANGFHVRAVERRNGEANCFLAEDVEKWSEAWAFYTIDLQTGEIPEMPTPPVPTYVLMNARMETGVIPSTWT